MYLTDASSNLFSRPADEHFQSFPVLRERCHQAQKHGAELRTDPLRTFFIAKDGQIRVVLADDTEAVPTNYCLTQLSTACRVPLPLLARLDPSTTVKVLNETLPRDNTDGRLALVEHGEGPPMLRAMTSTAYSRLWDHEILQEIDRWLLPRGFVPAVPTKNAPGGKNLLGNTKPALFRGDRDMFCFFYSDKTPQDDGLGGLRKGLFVWNSEVGARAFGWSSFYFREMCGNFLVWDARDVKERRAIHKGDQLRKTWWRDFRLELIEVSQEAEAKDLEFFRVAARTPFVGDGSPTEANRKLAVERLVQQFELAEGLASAAVEAAILPENPGDLTVWGIANGITSVAKGGANAAGLAEASRMAGVLIRATTPPW